MVLNQFAQIKYLEMEPFTAFCFRKNESIYINSRNHLFASMGKQIWCYYIENIGECVLVATELIRTKLFW